MSSPSDRLALGVEWKEIASPEEARPFFALTFSAYRTLLENFESSRSLAIGAIKDGKPIALALYDLKAPPLAHLLSLYVLPGYRRQKIASRLMQRSEQKLTARAFEEIEITYRSGREATPGLEALLAREGWTDPRVRQIYCQTNCRKMQEAAWIQPRELPPEYQIISWSEVTDEDRESIRTRQEREPFFPEELNPLNHEVGHEPINSLALRYRGEVAGWMITHRSGPQCIRYTCSYLRPDLQSVGRIVALYGEALRRQNAVMGDESIGIWTVPVNLPRMAAFVRRRFAPYLLDLAEFRLSRKSLRQTSTTRQPLEQGAEAGQV